MFNWLWANIHIKYAFKRDPVHGAIHNILHFEDSYKDGRGFGDERDAAWQNLADLIGNDGEITHRTRRGKLELYRQFPKKLHSARLFVEDRAIEYRLCDGHIIGKVNHWYLRDDEWKRWLKSDKIGRSVLFREKERKRTEAYNMFSNVTGALTCDENGIPFGSVTMG